MSVGPTYILCAKNNKNMITRINQERSKSLSSLMISTSNNSVKQNQIEPNIGVKLFDETSLALLTLHEVHFDL